MAGDKSMEMFALPLLAAAPPQAAVLALAALAIYAAAALRLAEGQYADFYNLAFDFDPPRYVALAVLFAVSGCQVFTAIIPEAYGPAAFGIACVWRSGGLAVWRLVGYTMVSPDFAVVWLPEGIGMWDVRRLAPLRRSRWHAGAHRHAGRGIARAGRRIARSGTGGGRHGRPSWAGGRS